MTISGLSGAAGSLMMAGMRGRPEPPSFDKMDADGSGGVSLDEFKAAGPKGKGGDDSRVAELFDKIDADDDGSISKEEDDAFKAQMQARMQSMMVQAQSFAQDAVDMFDEADSDDDGAVSRTEFDAMAPKGPAGDDARAEELFAEIDADGDGSITKAEDDSFRSRMDAMRGGRGASVSASLTIQASSAYGSAAELAEQLVSALIGALEAKTA